MKLLPLDAVSQRLEARLRMRVSRRVGLVACELLPVGLDRRWHRYELRLEPILDAHAPVGGARKAAR